MKNAEKSLTNAPVRQNSLRKRMIQNVVDEKLNSIALDSMVPPSCTTNEERRGNDACNAGIPQNSSERVLNRKALMSEPRLLSVAELKRDYKFSHTGVWRAIHAGHIEAVKVGVRTFIIRETVERYLAGLPRIGQSAA